MKVVLVDTESKSGLSWWCSFSGTWHLVSSPVAAVKFTINNQLPLNHESKHSTYLVLVVAVENILVSALALISPLSPLEVLEGKQSDTAQSVKIPNATQGKKSNIFSHKWQLQIFTTISPPWHHHPIAKLIAIYALCESRCSDLLCSVFSVSMPWLKFVSQIKPDLRRFARNQKKLQEINLLKGSYDSFHFCGSVKYVCNPIQSSEHTDYLISYTCKMQRLQYEWSDLHYILLLHFNGCSELSFPFFQEYGHHNTHRATK